MADYKILQNIDLAQNEIKEVYKISNDRKDGKDKGLRIQTGENTSLAFNRKDGDIVNSIIGAVTDETSENKSALSIEPSKVVLSYTKGTKTPPKSTITVGLNNSIPASENIEVVSPSINIGTYKGSSTSVSIGNDSSADVTLKGKSNFSIEANNADSKVQANDIKFNTSLSSNNIKIRWDSALNSLVFEKA